MKELILRLIKINILQLSHKAQASPAEKPTSINRKTILSDAEYFCRPQVE